MAPTEIHFTEFRDGTKLCGCMTPHLPHQWTTINSDRSEVIYYCVGVGHPSHRDLITYP